jgi:hypothetical protein
MPVPEFLAGATLLKGATYKSEREDRIVAIRGTAKAAKHVVREYPDQFDATVQLPKIRARPHTGKHIYRPVRWLGPSAAGQARHHRARRRTGGVGEAGAVAAWRCAYYYLALFVGACVHRYPGAIMASGTFEMMRIENRSWPGLYLAQFEADGRGWEAAN